MTYHSTIKQRISDLEQRIQLQQGNLEEMTRELERLKLTEFEEDLRSEDNKKLLLG